jgi:FkbM family methyltransferase
MPPTPALRHVLQKLVAQSPLVYVDCGARKGRLPRWVQPIRDTEYVGFEADAEECARLNASPRRGHRYIPAFLGRDVARRTFFVTRSPSCSSLLRPNLHLLNAFAGLAPLFEVERTIEVDTVSLDRCLEAHAVPPPDFLELDTQGAELEILEGSVRALGESIVGVQVEIEFAPMYVGQPLFADVDTWLRGRGFQLFDLSRYRARREALDPSVPTRGQLLWGHALYLRNAEGLSPDRAVRLAIVAALLDRPDLAVDVFRGIPDSAVSTQTARLMASAIDLVSDGRRATLADAWKRVSGAVRGSAPDVEAALAASRGRTTWRD